MKTIFSLSLFVTLFLFLFTCSQSNIKEKQDKKIDDFSLINITKDTLQLARYPFSNGNNKGIIYIISGSIKNNTEKTFTKIQISGGIQLFFDKKQISSTLSLFDCYINKEQIMDWELYNFDNLWKPGEVKNISFTTIPIDKIYLNYTPNNSIFLLTIRAEDPVGYVTHEVLYQRDLKIQWTTLNTIFYK